MTMQKQCIPSLSCARDASHRPLPTKRERGTNSFHLPAIKINETAAIINRQRQYPLYSPGAAHQ